MERVAGLSVIERQIAQVRSLGAKRVLVAIERMPPGLALALEKAGVEIVRASRGFAIDPDDPVLVIEDGLVVDRRIIEAVLKKDAPALAVWKGRATREGAERIDPSTHWSGVALYPGAFVAEVLAGLGEWDLQATLLRAAFTESRPTRVDVAALDTYDPEQRRLVPLRGRGHLPLPRPIEMLLDYGVAAGAFSVAAIVAGSAAAIGFATGWLWPGLALALVVRPLERIGDTLARSRDERRGRLDRAWLAGRAVAIGWCAALAGHFSLAHEPGAPWALAALIVVSSLGSAVVAEAFRRITGRHLDDSGEFERRFSRIAGRRDTFLWSSLPFAVIGAWYAGLAWLAIYGVLSYAIVQARFFVRLLEFTGANSPLMAANIAAARTQLLSGRDQRAS